MINTSATRDARIELRATTADKLLIQRAADACNRNLSDFAVSALVTEAQRVLADRAEFALSPEAWSEWEKINSRPARDLPSLRKLMARPSPFSK